MMFRIMGIEPDFLLWLNKLELHIFLHIARIQHAFMFSPHLHSDFSKTGPMAYNYQNEDRT
jgi:hypothetical protein